MLQTSSYNILARRLPQLTSKHSPTRRNITNISHIMGKNSYGYIPKKEIKNKDTELLHNLLEGKLRTQLLEYKLKQKDFSTDDAVIKELLSPITKRLEEENPELIFSLENIRESVENNAHLHIDALPSDVAGQGVLLLNTGKSTLYFERLSDIFEARTTMEGINKRFVKTDNKEKFIQAVKKSYSEMESKNPTGSAFFFKEKESSKGLVHSAPFDVNKPEYLEQMTSYGRTFISFEDELTLKKSRFLIIFGFIPKC